MKSRFLAVLITASVIAGCVSTAPKTASQQPEGEDPNYDASGKAKAVKVTQTERGVQITSDERVLFDTGKSEIKQDGMVFVERVADILNTRTTANVLVEGHTDNVGGAAYNQQLSERRAAAVKDALVKRGVAGARVQAQAFGMSKPVADNSTPDGRQANRRTEIIVLGETEANITKAPVKKGEAAPAEDLSLADQLSSGLDRFLKDAGAFIKSVFGKDS